MYLPSTRKSVFVQAVTTVEGKTLPLDAVCLERGYYYELFGSCIAATEHP